MATAPIIRTVAAAVVNATTLPVFSFGIPKQYQPSEIRHSGFALPADIAYLVAGEAIEITTTLWDALSLVGLDGLAVTTLELHAGKMGDLLREATASSVHTQWTLGGSGTKGKAFLRPFTVAQDQLALCTIVIVPFHALTRSNTDALPTPDTPTLHTLGNVAYDAGPTVLPGVQQVTFDPGNQPDIIRSDGQQFNVDAKLITRAPTASWQSDDPISVAAALTDTAGDLSSSLGLYFREHNPATGLHLSTGFSLTIAAADGKVRGPDINGGEDQVARGEIEVAGVGSSSNPWSLSANNVSMPE